MDGQDIIKHMWLEFQLGHLSIGQRTRITSSCPRVIEWEKDSVVD